MWFYGYWCWKFVELLESQKSSFSIFPLLKRLRRTLSILTRGVQIINYSIVAEERDQILEICNFIGQLGLQVPFNESNARALDYFKLFATSDFYQLISDQKNCIRKSIFRHILMIPAEFYGHLLQLLRFDVLRHCIY